MTNPKDGEPLRVHTEEEIKEMINLAMGQPPKPYNTIASLWEKKPNSDNIAYSGRIMEQIVIPAGSMLHIIRNPNKERDNDPRACDFYLAWSPKED
jgi:hypothetical protein